MSATEIKNLIGKFNDVLNQCEYADFMITNKDLSKEEQEEWEEESSLAECELYEIANQIWRLGPSKYMMNKYPELVDILEFAT